MTQTVEAKKCKQCGVVTSTPQHGLCTICHENRMMLGKMEEENE